LPPDFGQSASACKGALQDRGALGQSSCPAACQQAQSTLAAQKIPGTPVQLLSRLCMVGDSTFLDSVTGCLNQFRVAAGSRAALVVQTLDTGSTPWVLLGPSYTVPSNATLASPQGSGQNGNLRADGSVGPGTNAIIAFNPALGPFLDGEPREVCSSLVHEFEHAVLITGGSNDLTMYPGLSVDVPMGSGWVTDPAQTASLPEEELEALSVENSWRPVATPPMPPRTRDCASPTRCINLPNWVVRPAP
jgi:hypothetical protein